MRVVQVITQLERAGAQTAAWKLERALSQHADVTTVFLYKKYDSDIYENSSALLAQRPGSLSELRRLFRGLRSEMRQSDVVIAHTHYSIAICLLVALTISKGPAVVAVHHWPVSKYPLPAKIAIGAAVVLSRCARRKLREVHVTSAYAPSDALIIGNVSDQPLMQYSEEFSNDILIVARHAREKSIDTAIIALSYLPGRRITLVGAGPLTESLRTLAKDFGVGERVHFMGLRSNDETLRLMRASNVFVLPSTWEAQPMVILEALSQRAQVVLSRIPAHMPYIEAKAATGFPVEQPRALARAIEGLQTAANTPGAIEAVLSEHSPEVVARKWVSLLEEVR